MSKWILYLENLDPITPPKHEDLEQYLNRLDGVGFTLIELTHVGKGTLMAIGGNNGCVMVTYIPENPEDDSPSLADKTNLSVEDIELTFEGEATPYPARFCVSKDLALKAFDSFLLSGTLDSSLTWEMAY